jgi:hypothetical protein
MGSHSQRVTYIALVAEVVTGVNSGYLVIRRAGVPGNTNLHRTLVCHRRNIIVANRIIYYHRLTVHAGQIVFQQYPVRMTAGPPNILWSSVLFLSLQANVGEKTPPPVSFPIIHISYYSAVYTLGYVLTPWS